VGQPWVKFFLSYEVKVFQIKFDRILSITTYFRRICRKILKNIFYIRIYCSWGSVSGPTLGPKKFFSPDLDSTTQNYWEMMFFKILFIGMWPSPLLVQLGQFVGHVLVPKKFRTRIKI
jgi:hypothetical protein